MIRMHGLKCVTCPYYQGRIKCVIDPCKESMQEKRKTHPFHGLTGAQRSRGRCPICGGRLNAAGKCPNCNTVY